jgi:hypothetical protein
MADEKVNYVRVHLTREQAPIRKARLEMTGTDVTFGVPGWQGEHYGFAPGSVPEYPGTLDYLVASVAGCLIGTYGGTLKARGLEVTGDQLVADATGEVGVDRHDHAAGGRIAPVVGVLQAQDDVLPQLHLGPHHGLHGCQRSHQGYWRTL